MQKTKDVKNLELCKESKFVIKNYKVPFNRYVNKETNKLNTQKEYKKTNQ